MVAITPPELKAMLVEMIDLVLVNVMSQESFERQRIPRSHNLSASDEDFVKKVERLAGTKYRAIAVYGSGDGAVQSGIAARMLTGAGFSSVLHLESGLEGWIGSGLEIEPA